MRVLFLWLLFIINSCESARILCVFLCPSISHQVVFRPIVHDLTLRGHEIVVITPDPVKYKDPRFGNLTEIDTHDVSYEIFNQDINMVEIRDKAGSHSLEFYSIYQGTSAKIFDKVMQQPQVAQLLKDKEQHFDLVIYEIFFPAALAFAEWFNTPIIGVSSMPGTVNHFEDVGSPTHPIIYPDILNNHVKPKTIWERMESIYNYLLVHYIHRGGFKQYDDLIAKHFRPNMRKIADIAQDIDMLFGNMYRVLCGIRPVTPAYIFLGGMHLQEKKAIPQDLLNYLDKSKRGIVYFSLGSNVKSIQLPNPLLKQLMEAFRELKYDVLWKFEADDLVDKPDNVRISKWLPQYELLGHKNIKVFVTQGGQQSMEEAVHNGVPTIAIPFIGDQDKNAKMMEFLGMGYVLDFKSISKESFKEAVNEVIGNPKYKENAMRLKGIINDEPMTSRERAVWWTEYVLRHKGAKHLRSPIMDVPLHEYYMLDIFGLLATAVIVFLTIVLKIVKKCCGKLEKKKLKHS